VLRGTENHAQNHSMDFSRHRSSRALSALLAWIAKLRSGTKANPTPQLRENVKCSHPLGPSCLTQLAHRVATSGCPFAVMMTLG
jgi:hypothetical protein